MDKEYLFLGRDNTIDLTLKEDGTAKDLSAVTKITASFGSTLISSEDATGGAIQWSGDDFGTGEVRIVCGDQDIAAGEYTVTIIVYDATNDDGIHWMVAADKLAVPIEVVADQEAS